MPGGLKNDRTRERPARGIAELRADLSALKERLTRILDDLDRGDAEQPPAAQRSHQHDDDEMVDPGWAAQYIKLSKDRLKDLAKQHGFGWKVGGRIKIHKGRFFEYILTHRPDASGQ